VGKQAKIKGRMFDLGGSKQTEKETKAKEAKKQEEREEKKSEQKNKLGF